MLAMVAYFLDSRTKRQTSYLLDIEMSPSLLTRFISYFADIKMPPSLSTQRKIMKSLSKIKINCGDFWDYAISEAWLNSWQEATNQIESDEQPQSGFDSYAHVSADGHKTTYHEESKCMLRSVSMSEIDSENAWIPESQWKLYVSWFGLDPKHTLLRRPFVSLYMSLDPHWSNCGTYVICDKVLDFLPVWVGDLDEVIGRNTKHLLQVFAWDNFAHIEHQIRRILSVSKKKTVRMWINVHDNDSDLLIEPIYRLEQSLISKVIDAVPSIVKLMERREKQQPPYVTKIEGAEKAGIRKALANEWFGTKILSISIGLEETGLDMKAGTANMWDSCTEVQEGLDSIVTISSIRNEWDDVLATYFDTYMEEMGNKTTEIKDQLLCSARNIVGEKLEELDNIRDDYERRFAMIEQREAMASKREQTIKEQEEDLTKRLSRFKTGLQDFHARQQKLDEDLKRIESQNRIAESRVSLNIGGHIFTTSILTLTKIEDSLLATMFSGRHNLQREADGSFFIDRDGTNFRFVLNYLRDGDNSVDIIPDNAKLLQELMSEAEFYKLPVLKCLLEKKLEIVRALPQSSMDSMPYLSHQSV